MDDRPRFSKGYLAWALIIIFSANFLNYLDRMVVSGLEKELKDHFTASAEAFGFLWTAFTLGYMFTSPFIGFLADRVKRTRMFALCVVVWSAATIGCGLVESYWLFFAMRVMIGVGEAGCLVIGPALISDYFPKNMRGRALSAFFLGMPLGGALGYMTAGWAGWPHAFYFAGIPGFAVAAAIFFLDEPERGGSEPGSMTAEELMHAPPPKADFKSYVHLLKTRSLLYIILAQAFAVFTLVPMLHFGIGFLENKLPGQDKHVVTTLLGVIVLIGGPLGNFLGGYIGDRMRKKDPGAYSRIAAVGFAMALPCVIIGLKLFPQPLSYPLLFLAFTLLFGCMPVVNTQIANVVHPSQRAVAYAAAVFILHILGDALSPPLFGYINSLRSDGGDFAFTVFPFSLLIASMFCLMARRHAAKDVARVDDRLEKDRTRVHKPDAPNPE